MGISERKEKERQARRTRILNAGVRVFARYGYHQASMDLIAEEAELGKSTLYYYYKSKESLLLGILTQGIKEFFEQLEKTFSLQNDPLEKLSITIDESVAFFERHPDYFKLYMYLNVHPSFRKKIFRQIHPLLTQKIAMIGQVFQEGQKQGCIRDDIPANQLLSLFGSLVMGMGIFSGAHKKSEHLKQQAQYVKDVFFHGVKKQNNGT